MWTTWSYPIKVTIILHNSGGAQLWDKCTLLLKGEGDGERRRGTLNWWLNPGSTKVRLKLGQREGSKVTFSDCFPKNTGYKGIELGEKNPIIHRVYFCTHFYTHLAIVHVKIYAIHTPTLMVVLLKKTPSDVCKCVCVCMGMYMCVRVKYTDPVKCICAYVHIHTSR